MEPNNAHAVTNTDGAGALGHTSEPAATQISVSSRLRQKSKDFLDAVGSGRWKAARKSVMLLKEASK